MKKGDYLTTLLRSKKTVFSIQDIALLWQDPSTSTTRVRLNYYTKKGMLYRIRRGLYAKDRNYSRLELATRIFTPSYVSFETVLAREGLIFQYDTTIYIASYLTRALTIDGQTYQLKKIKDPILLNAQGILLDHDISIATRERALLDSLYINRDYHFDNVRTVDWNVVFEILPMYENRRMTHIVNNLYKKNHT